MKSNHSLSVIIVVITAVIIAVNTAVSNKTRCKALCVAVDCNTPGFFYGLYFYSRRGYKNVVA
ncbi:hypothetical protein JYT79_00565 [Cardiobacterium sp. AH-315-I02]|nr:hypothetical protein [Cardiobacterium sp. AH-315-I02]